MKEYANQRGRTEEKGKGRDQKNKGLF